MPDCCQIWKNWQLVEQGASPGHLQCLGSADRPSDLFTSSFDRCQANKKGDDTSHYWVAMHSACWRCTNWTSPWQTWVGQLGSLMGPGALMGGNLLSGHYKSRQSRPATLADVVVDFQESTIHTKRLRRHLRTEVDSQDALVQQCSFSPPARWRVLDF